MEAEKIEYVFNHQMPIQVRFSDIDILGHVNNAIYMNYFDLAKTKYFEAVKGDLMDWSRSDVVVANVNVNFFHPVFLNDEIVIKTKVIHLGNKSLNMIQQLVEINTDIVKTVCTTVMVGFDVPTNKSKPLSDKWKESICRFEKGITGCELFS